MSRADSKADEKILSEAKRRFARSAEWESASRERYREDVKFSEGDSENNWQWPNNIYNDRSGSRRPALTMNKVRQHCLQIINDARQNKAAIKVTPTGDGATYEAAQMFSGLCRHIEYQSQATEAYEAATNSQVRGGWGYWRVLTDYEGDDSLNLEIYIRRIADPTSVYLDPEIQQFDGSDAKWGFVTKQRPHDDALLDHPELRDTLTGPYNQTDGWVTEDDCREAEYYRVVDSKDTLHQLDDGTMARGEVPAGRTSLKSRSIVSPKVEWFKIVGNEIVDREDWPGRYVPLVRVIGEETVIDGKLDRKGHTRAIKDAQRTKNYWMSAAVEFVALQGKTPYIGQAASIEGYEEDWNNAHLENKALLLFNGYDDAGRELAPPHRQEPPTMAQAYLQGMTIADNEMMAVSGQYQAEMGAPGNERSGVAIEQRQRQGDNATYHYIDHLAQAIRFTGRILVDLIPHIYDTPRVLKIMADDGSESEVHIDPTMSTAHAVTPDPTPQPMDPSGQTPTEAESQQQRVRTFLNPSVGRYMVQADVGPSFGTQRQEAFSAFEQIVSQNKELMPLIGDLMFSNADYPGADVIAERLKRMVPPQALGGPSPAMQQMQQHLQTVTGHGQAVAQQADKDVADLKDQIAALKLKLDAKDGEGETKDYESETRRLVAITAADPTVASILARSLLSGMIGMPALPLIQAHDAANAAHGQGLAAMAPPPDPGAPGGAPAAPTPQPQAATA